MMRWPKNIFTDDVIRKRDMVTDGKEILIVNGFVELKGEPHMLVDDHYWNTREYRAKHCRIVPCDGWNKIV